MTIALHIPHRRHKPAPLNHSAYPCGICWASPLTAHDRTCNEVTGPHGMPHPAEARVFRGLLIGLLLAAPGWALFFAFLIWS